MKRTLTYVCAALFFCGWVSCTNPSSGGNATDTGTAEKSGTTGSADSNVDVQIDYSSLDSANAKAWLITPGQSVGLTHLNENADSIYQRLGKPDGGDAAMQKAVAVWYTNHDSTNHSVAIYTSRDAGVDPIARIQQIRITSPHFKTAEGIHTTSTVSEIQNVFAVKKIEEYKDAGTTYTVYDSKQGLAFEVDPDAVCVAIIVHPAGATSLGTYLKFRTTNKFFSKAKSS